MITTIKHAPLNSLVVINDVSDRTRREVPAYVPGAPVMATGSCIAVCCYPEQDGETEFTVGDVAEVDPGWDPIFVGFLQTPSRKIILETSEPKIILQAPTPQILTHLWIWTNHRKWPDKVIIGISSATSADEKESDGSSNR
jgi:hypothetical protein